MKGKTNLIFYALLPTLLFVGGYDLFDTTDLTSVNLAKSRFERDDDFTNETNLFPDPFLQTNNKPVVKIIEPKDKTPYPSGTRLVYEISVFDKEDWESKYGEIPQNEVLLKVEYLESANMSVESDKNRHNDHSGLTGILTSNCLNCHAFKDKLIGPSFYEISKHYEPTQPNLESMAKHIRDGSSGIWGNAVMPSHPELSNQEILEMLQWIMENAGRSNIEYFTGTEGSIKLTPPVNHQKNNSILLTASYTDHGVNGSQKLKGQDSIVIYAK